MAKKILLLILSGMLIITSLAACRAPAPESSTSAPSSVASNQPASSEAAKAKPFEGKTVRFLAINHNWTNAAQLQFDKFTAETGIKIEMESMTQTQLTEKVAIESASKSKTLDIFMYRPQAQRALYEKNGWLRPIEDYVAASPKFQINDFYESALSVCKSNGKLSGIPLTTEKLVVYYRKDLLNAKGIAVPKTLEELEKAAAALTDKSKNQFGIVMRGKRGQAITIVSAFVQSMGGTFGPVDGKATYNTPEAIKGYETYARLLREYGPPGVLNMTVVECSQMFAQGSAAFYIDSDNERMSVLNPEKSTVIDKVGFATFPTGDAGAKPWNACFWALGISPFSNQPEVAWEFAKFIMSPEIALEIHRAGSPSARKTPWLDKQSIEKWPAGWKEVMEKTAQIGVGSVLPNVINLEKARDLSDGIVTSAIEGADVKKAAEAANIEYQKIIDEEKK